MWMRVYVGKRGTIGEDEEDGTYEGRKNASLSRMEGFEYSCAQSGSS